MPFLRSIAERTYAKLAEDFPNMSDAKELPVAVSENTVEIGGVKIRVYQLSDGRRVIHADDIALLFDQFTALG